MFQIIKEALSLLIALGAGIYAFRYMNRFTRILFFQLVIWILFYLWGRGLTLYQKVHHIDKNNQWIFNIHMPVEILLLVIAAYYYFQDKIKKQLTVILYTLFLIIFIIQIDTCGSLLFANYGLAAEAMVTTILFILVLYNCFKTGPGAWKYSPEIWASLGLVIFFACNVPYFSFFNYLNDNHPKMSLLLYHIINDILANIRYFFLAVAFWLTRRNATLINSKTV